MGNKEHKVVVRHLRKARDFGKQILNTTPEDGSALISHEFVIKTEVEPGSVMESRISFLPLVRLYKDGKDKIVNDENLLNEDVEDGFD